MTSSTPPTTSLTSEFTDKPITPSQKLAEIVCKRLAEHRKVPLPYRFWQYDEWKIEYQKQVRFASALLKIHSFKAILNALNRDEAKGAYSLGGKWWQYLIPLEEDRLMKEAAKLLAESVRLEEELAKKEQIRFNIETKKKSTLSKLD